MQVVVVALASVTVKLTAVLVEVWLEPLAGALMLTTGFVLSAVKVTEAEPEPPGFVAVTTIVWLPSASVESDSGLVQAAAAAASILQVTLVGELVAVNVSDAVVWLTTALAAGALIVTTGGETGWVTENVVDAVPTLPARSVDVTVIVWLPTARPV